MCLNLCDTNYNLRFSSASRARLSTRSVHQTNLIRASTHRMSEKNCQLQSTGVVNKVIVLALCLSCNLAQASEHCEKTSNHWLDLILAKKSTQGLRCDPKALRYIELDLGYEQSGQDDNLFRKSVIPPTDSDSLPVFNGRTSRYSSVSGYSKKEDIETLRGFNTLN